MRSNSRPITETFGFRVAQAVLPQHALMALFGRRVPVTADRRMVVLGPVRR